MIQESSLMEQRYYRFDQDSLVLSGPGDAVAKSLPLPGIAVAKLLPLPDIAVTNILPF